MRDEPDVILLNSHTIPTPKFSEPSSSETNIKNLRKLQQQNEEKLARLKAQRKDLDVLSEERTTKRYVSDSCFSRRHNRVIHVTYRRLLRKTFKKVSIFGDQEVKVYFHTDQQCFVFITCSTELYVRHASFVFLSPFSSKGLTTKNSNVTRAETRTITGSCMDVKERKKSRNKTGRRPRPLPKGTRSRRKRKSPAKREPRRKVRQVREESTRNVDILMAKEENMTKEEFLGVLGLMAVNKRP